MRPPVRLSALARLGSIWVYTHDSIGLGEDGPTHQPVEHLIALRAIPDLLVIRPADANETVWAWWVAPEPAPADGPRVHPPERADPRSLDLRIRRRVGVRRLCAQPAVRGVTAAGHHSDRHWFRGPAHRRRRACPRDEGHQGAAGVHAVLGALRGAAGRVPRTRVAVLGDGAAGR